MRHWTLKREKYLTKQKNKLRRIFTFDCEMKSSSSAKNHKREEKLYKTKSRSLSSPAQWVMSLHSLKPPPSDSIKARFDANCLWNSTMFIISLLTYVCKRNDVRSLSIWNWYLFSASIAIKACSFHIFHLLLRFKLALLYFWSELERLWLVDNVHAHERSICAPHEAFSEHQLHPI